MSRGIFRRPPYPFQVPRELQPNIPAVVVDCLEATLLAHGATSIIWFDVGSGDISDQIDAAALVAAGTPAYGETGPVPDHPTGIEFDNIADKFTGANKAAYQLGNDNWSALILYRRDTDIGGPNANLTEKGANEHGFAIAGSTFGGALQDKLCLVETGTAYLCATANTIPIDATVHAYHCVRNTNGAGNTEWYTDGVAGHTDGTIGNSLSDTSTSLVVGSGSDGTAAGALFLVAFFKGIQLTAGQIAEQVAAITVACAGGLVEVTWTSAVAQADVWTRTGTFLRAVTQTVTQADVWTRVGTFIRTWTSAVTQADVWVQSRIIIRSFTDAVAQADVWTRTGTFLRTWTSSVAQADVWTRLGTLARTWASAVAQADVWTRTGTFLRTWTSAVSQADVWTGAKIIARSFSDAVTQADVWTRTASLSRSWTSAVTQADVWTRVATLARTITEAVSQADTWVATVLGAIIRSFTESVTQADVWTRTGTFGRTFTSAVTQLEAWVATNLGSGVIGGIGRGISFAIHHVPGAIARHLPGSGSANQSKPTGSADHATPSGDADHDVPDEG